jgi:hypothetical protein
MIHRPMMTVLAALVLLLDHANVPLTMILVFSE